MKKICSQCGSLVKPRQFTKGSIGMELLLWLFFILPGIIYSIWRLTTRYCGCPRCGSDKLVGINSPIGRSISDMIEKRNVKNSGLH